MDKIVITPDKDGKYYITLYGIRYEIVIKDTSDSSTTSKKTK